MGKRMAAKGYTPTFSIAIEWENARFAELERSRRMLRRLRQELIELHPPRHPPEIDILYDRFSIDGELVSSVVDEEFRPQETPATVRIMPTDRLRYYEQKNLGAARAGGEIVIFLDCDVIPEPGWLSAMLASFDDPAVAVVGGETYVELEDLCSKAFALFWFFNLRNDGSDLAPAPFFHANNVAFRREVFLDRRFPDLPLYRAQCTVLCASLLSEGVAIFRQQKARVSHPCPRTIGYFVARALHNGRDVATVDSLREGGNGVRFPARWRSAYRSFRDNLGNTLVKTRRHRGEVALSRAGAVAAFSIAFAYFSLRAVGEVVTLYRPNLIARLFPI